ncbi:MAG: transglycosylase family protein [Solirubrobacterales bacterium]
MFNRWRYPAALAVSVGIAFPTLAVAASGPEASDKPDALKGPGLAHKAAQSGHRSARVLERPFKRLHKTIDVHVRRIRAEQRRKRERAFANLPGGVSQETLDAIASCESGGDPTAVSSDGSYRGKYQFDYGTWASVGGSGDPAVAPEAEQDHRAALLYAQSGSSPWPVCG